jgi:hypothetical protein
MRCESCGVESPLKEAFHRVPRFFRVPGIGAQSNVYCPPCWERLVARRTRWLVTLYLVLSAPVVTWLILNPESLWAWFLTAGATYLAFLGVVVILHELGHFACGKLLQARVFRVTIGVGATLWRGKFGETVFEFKTLPLAGYNLFGYPDLAWMRMNHFLVVLGGPFVNAMALVPLVALISMRGPLGGAYLYALVLGVAWAIANVTLLASSLPPYYNKIGDLSCKLPSDGLALLTTPFLSIEKRRSMHARYFMQEADAAFQDGRIGDARRWSEYGLHYYPGEPTLQFLMGTFQVRQGEYWPARELLLSLLARDDLNPSARVLILNNIAWADLMLGNCGLMGEADAFSAEAWTALPWRPALCGTRGAVLVTKGDLQPGIDLLRIALKKNEEPYNRAVNACFLALGEARRGDFAAALSYLETAGKLDPSCPMLARVRAEVSRQ